MAKVTTDVGAVAEAVKAVMDLFREFVDPKKQMARLNVKRRKWDQKAMDAAESYIVFTEDMAQCDDDEIAKKISKKRDKAKDLFLKYN